MDSFILPRTNVTNWYLSSSVLFLSVLSSSFLRLPIPWPSHPTHFHDCAVSAFSSILRGFLDIVSSFLFAGSATISCLSTCRLFHDGANHSIGFFITSPSHCSPHTLSNFFKQDGQAHLYPYFSGHIARSSMEVDPCFFFMSFETEQAYHCLVFPSFHLSHRLYGPRPDFTRKYCIDVVHKSLTLYLPRNIIASVYENIHPECLVCRLHSLFSGIVHSPLTIHSTAQFVECIFKKGICSIPTKCPNSCHSFLLNRTYLSTTDLLAWVPGPSACFFNKIS